MAATFFRAYWIILPQGSGFREPLVQQLNELKYRSIGVAELADPTVMPMLEPSGPPAPDNQELARPQLIDQAVASKSSRRKTAA
jgi:hypothetical protein